MSVAALQTRLFSEENLSDDLLKTIDSADFSSLVGSNFSRMFVEIPGELLLFGDDQMLSEGVRVQSFLYDNVGELFPGSLPGGDEYVRIICLFLLFTLSLFLQH